MYEWLTEALDGSSQIVTANRRLSRVLAVEYGTQQLALGHTVWRSPAIRSWQDWIDDLITSAELAVSLPVRINGHQSRVLWERCLRREVSDPLLSISMLVRHARDAWARLHDFSVPLSKCDEAAQGRDQRIFVSAAKNYQSILDREGWIDDAGIVGLLTRLIVASDLSCPDRITLAGFDSLVPQATQLLDAMRASGTRIDEKPAAEADSTAFVHAYENSEAELRAAGSWARRQLSENPDQVIAIVATQLEQKADVYARMIREGLAPGWQIGGARHEAAVNVSYGRKMTEYPAVAIALLALRWLQDDLTSRDVSALLRTSMIGQSETCGRHLLELYLRELPDRQWSPEMLIGAIGDRGNAEDARDWLARVESINRLRSKLPRRAQPSEWVVLIDAALTELNWPGAKALDSFAYQLVNRWRELLNEFARLRLVSPTMTFAEVFGRLSTMATETIFQAESDGSLVQLLGPLEAAGMRFDQLWVAGLTAANWPAAGRPSFLISRRLQRQFGMPDADPQDTLDYTRRVLKRLVASADSVVCSYPLTDGDAEQTESGLLADLGMHSKPGPADPGWYAVELMQANKPIVRANDRVPAVTEDERISGGAGTIQRQLTDPFSAFVSGRLGVRYLPGITTGLAASLRGNLIHDALHDLYVNRPAQSDIAAWSDSDLSALTKKALQKAFARHERHADEVLQEILGLERKRIARLIRQVVNLDLERNKFSIADVEVSLQAVIGGLTLRLRVDRIDKVQDGEIVILDYKSGMHRKFLGRDRMPNDIQLVVYSCAIDEPVAGLGLVNVDSRSIDIDGAGKDLTPDLDWAGALPQWQDEVANAASEIRRGDVRIGYAKDTEKSRPYGLLSRISELRRDI